MPLSRIIKTFGKDSPPATLCVALRAGNGMFYYTYVLLSEADGNFYTGFTSDLKERVIKHNKGLVQATKSRRPLRLVYFEACLSEKKAITREKQLKTGFGRAYLKRRIG